ncbi:MAG: hypothetical protein FJ304_08930 [Planctomycetes bacterium]|nr:hypothetical protein [Planctomycetota bacterium]
MTDETRTRTAPPATAKPETTAPGGATVDHAPAAEQGTVVRAPGSAPTVPDPCPAPTVGIEIRGYEVISELGRGAMGVVYQARHTRLNRLVALKMALGGRAEAKDLIRFLAEAEAVAAVKHPNVVQVYDYGDSAGHAYMALELCPGGSLAQKLRDGTRLTPRDAADLMGRIASGVAAAHEQGIVHRDLKPGNVLLTEEGEPKVADFGLAKRGTSELTATQAVMGTPSYMSPEQAGGKTKFVGPQADVWALGAMLYECLTGERPFPGETTDEVLSGVLTCDPPRVRSLAAGTPRDLDLICRTCLEKNPADRYPSARELADDLGRFVRGEAISVCPVGLLVRGARWTRRNPVVAGLLTAVVAVTFGLIGALYLRSVEAEKRADTEQREKESAEAAKLQSDIAKANAERATLETVRRQEAEKLAAMSAAQAAQADEMVALLDDMFRSSDPLVVFFGEAAPLFGATGAADGQAVTLGPFLRNAAARARASLTAPAVAPVRAKLLASIGNGMKNLGLLAEAEDALTEALALRRANLPDSHPDVWKSELDLGRCKGERGDVMGGIERFRAVRASVERAGGPADLVLTARLYEGISLSAVGLPEATAVLNDVVAGRDKLNGPNHKDTLIAKVAQVTNLIERGEWGEAVKRFAEFRRAVAEYPDPRFRGVFEPILDMQAKMAVANIPAGTGSLFAPNLRDTVKAIKADVARLEKQLTEDHVYVCILRFELAKLMARAGDDREADETYARVLADVKKAVGLSHPKALTLVETYGNRLAATKRADEGRALYRDAEAATRARFGPDSPWLVRVLVQRAQYEAKHGAPVAAAACATEAAAMIARGAFVPTAAALEDLRDAAEALGKVDATRAHALKLLALSVAPVEKVHGEASVPMVVLLSDQGKLLHRAGDRAAALAALERAEALVPRVPQLGPVGRNAVMYWRGKLELDRGRFADAERYFRPALLLTRAHADVRPVAREENAINLAIALAGQGRYADALPLMAEYQASRKRLKLSDADAAAGEMLYATIAAAAGARAEHEKLVRSMLARYNLTGAHGDVVARVGWAAALAPPAGWDAAAHAKRMATAVAPWPTFTWGYQGLALVRLRAGDFAGYEAALKQAARPDDPLTLVIRGLANATGGNPVAARAYLRRADEATDAVRPSAKRPFAYGDTYWYERVQYAALRDELLAQLAPPTAPSPRPLVK